MGNICCSRREDQDIDILENESIPCAAKISSFTVSEDINSIYQIDNSPLGAQKYGSVRKATFKTKPEYRNMEQSQFVIRTIYKSKIQNMEYLKEEIEVLMTADHPNIIKFFETYEDKMHFHTVMEACSGGSLLDVISEKQTMHEREAAQYLYKIMGAVNYLHEINIYHEDLKPSCFLFENQDYKAELKLVKFGLEKKFGKDDKDNQKITTPYFSAPEILRNQKSDASCDVWSIGIMLYLMIGGKIPFGGFDDQDVYYNICKGK